MTDHAHATIALALERSEARFRQVVESLPSAMVMIRSTGQIEMVNAQAERVFGYTRAELLGRPLEMLVPHRLRGGHPGLRQAFFGDPRARPMGGGRDLHALRKDGTELPVEIGLNPIETADGMMVLAAIVDISDRNQKELSLQAALKEKDLLLGEIHHRVKNNLQIVHSLLGLQALQLHDAAAIAPLTESQNRIRSMALIHQTLYQSKDFARVDFSSFLDMLVPTLVSSCSADPELLTLAIDTAAVSLPIQVAIPCGLIVNELVSNALKHAFPDGRRGEIRIALATESDSGAVLSVTDDGVGIPDALDPEHATTLGLQLVWLLADQIGAEIAIHRSAPTQVALRFGLEA